MRLWCPHCGAEYVEGWQTCSDCGVALVGTPPVATFAEPEIGNDIDDPFVPVWEGPTPEARDIVQRIEAEHIPVELGESHVVGHARVEVPRSYLVDLKDVLTGQTARWPSEVTRYTPDGFDWKPSVRVLLALVALGLILLIAFGR